MSYTSVHLSHDKAKKKLESALMKALSQGKPVSIYQCQIKQVILGSHLTYRYILITNLLAKAIEASVNALALQVGANFDGAFDSRSLCHKVIVPFERNRLQDRLGGSNEPYLNKPARHKALSLDNAVRRGKDKELLEACIYILSECSQADAELALVDALFFTLSRSSISDNTTVAISNGNTSAHNTLKMFSTKLLTISSEGEVCALLAGLAFHLFSYSLSGVFDVCVHPVNQSGASSKEILDVDVYSEGKLRFTAEVKDKKYSKEDVDHAANKVKLAKHDSMFFLEGPNAKTQMSEIEIAEIEQKHGVYICVIPIKEFFMTALGLSSCKLDTATVWEMVVKITQNARLKQDTIKFIRQTAAEVGIIK